MWRSFIAGVLLALAGAGPAAAGGTLTPLDAELVAGAQHPSRPPFAGTGVAWATQSDFKGGYDVSVLRDGDLVTKHLDTFASGIETDESFAASADAAALAVKVTGCDGPDCRSGTRVASSTVFAGPLGQPL